MEELILSKDWACHIIKLKQRWSRTWVSREIFLLTLNPWMWRRNYYCFLGPWDSDSHTQPHTPPTVLRWELQLSDWIWEYYLKCTWNATTTPFRRIGEFAFSKEYTEKCNLWHIRVKRQEISPESKFIMDCQRRHLLLRLADPSRYV